MVDFAFSGSESLRDFVLWMVYYLNYRLVLKVNFTLVPASFAKLETLRITVANIKALLDEDSNSKLM